MHKRTFGFGFILPALLPIAAQAGTVLGMSIKELPSGKESSSTTYAQDGHMRVENRPGDHTMIFKDDAIYSVDDKDRSYYVMDRAAMQKMAAQINPALKQMQEQMAKMPPEQRAQMERMMGGMPGMAKPSTQEIRKTSRTDDVAGNACTYVEVLEDGVLADEMCVAPAGALKGSKDLMDAAMKMSALVQDMLGSIDAPWLKDTIDRQAQNYQKIGGVPLRARHFENGKAVSESTLTSIRTEAVPASMFAVPAGYTKKDMMQQR